VVHQGDRPRLFLDELDQLRGRRAESLGRQLDVASSASDRVEGLGEDGGEVVVPGAYADPPARASRLPERAGLRVRLVRQADLQRQVQAEPEQGVLAIFGLAAPLVGLGGDAGGHVEQHDGRLHLVAVLPTGARAAQATRAAVGQQVLGIEGGGVDLVGSHLRVAQAWWASAVSRGRRRLSTEAKALRDPSQRGERGTFRRNRGRLRAGQWPLNRWSARRHFGRIRRCHRLDELGAGTAADEKLRHKSLRNLFCPVTLKLAVS
jgi:hypothetical protein